LSPTSFDFLAVDLGATCAVEIFDRKLMVVSTTNASVRAGDGSIRRQIDID
jgi:hypothetical protein